MKRIITKPVAVILFIIATQAMNAQCLLKEVTLTDRAIASDLIVEGKVISKESYWDAKHGMIYTMNTLEVYKVFKGTLTTTNINIITEGGIVGFDRITAEPGLELNIGDVGVFTSVSNRLPVPAYQNNIYPHYNAYANVQGFIRYDQISGRAADGFKIYDNLNKQVYQVIENQTHQTYKIVKAFSADNYFKSTAKLMANPSITNFSPTTITAGTKSQLTINGTGFEAIRGSGTVGFKNGNDGGSTYINPIATQYISWSDTQIIVEVPSNAGTGTITVNQGGTGTSGSSLTISYSELNATYDPGTGTQKYKTHHVSDNGSGGYTWQMHTAFDGNASAKASFIRAFDTWRCNTGVNWTIGSTTSTSVHSSDGTNVIAFDDNDALGAGVLGTCYSYWSSCDGSDWYVSELDIIFDNGSNISPRTWEYGTSLPSTNEYDFETVAVHELGHGHQLGHVINAGAIMHYAISNGTSNRSLSTNDLNGGNDVQSRSTAGNSCGTAMTNYSGCGTPPVANFTSNKTSVCAGGSVNFTDQSTNTPTSWAWTFSGGTPGTSTSQNPSITYSTPGTYNVTLTATNSNGSDGETKTSYITVNVNPSASSSVTNISCNGLVNGSVSASPSGGTSPYTYLWSTGSTAATITSLAVATYTCTVTDNKGCSVATTGAVTQPSVLSVSNGKTDATCGFNNGSATATPSGATPAYGYSWNNNVVSATNSNLSAGIYTVTVTDSKGCSATSSVTLTSGCIVPTTQLGASYCNITISSLGQTLHCNKVSVAQTYEYRVVNTSLGFTKTYNRGGAGTDFYMDSFSGLKYNTTYDVDVRVYAYGSWGSYGAVCQITTPPEPIAKLKSSSCGITLSTLSQELNCDYIPQALTYEYRVVNTTLGYSKTFNRGGAGTDFALSWLSGLKYGTTYDIDVRAYIGGSWGSYGTICQVTTPIITPTTRLNSSFNGITLSSLGQAMYCDYLPQATTYEYRIVNTSLGFSKTFNRGGAGTDFALSWISGLKYGVTYDIDVRAYMGGSWGSYGSVTQVTTPVLPTTKLASAYCGITLTSMDQVMYCDYMPLALSYEYRVSNSSLGFSQTFNRGGAGRDFGMDWIPGIRYATTYNVEIRAYANGAWGAYGSICQVTTPAFPTTKLGSAYCNITLSSWNQTLYCDKVVLAQTYEYRVTNTSLGYTKIFNRGAHALDFTIIDGGSLSLKSGTSYNVEVRAYVNGIWGNYGPICSVITPSGGVPVVTQTNSVNIMADVINTGNITEGLKPSSVIIYPNPISINGILSIDLEVMLDDESSGEIKIYNILGGIITHLAVTDTRLVELSIDERFNPGLYFIEITAGEHKQNKRIIVQ